MGSHRDAFYSGKSLNRLREELCRSHLVSVAGIVFQACSFDDLLTDSKGSVSRSSSTVQSVGFKSCSRSFVVLIASIVLGIVIGGTEELLWRGCSAPTVARPSWNHTTRPADVSTAVTSI